jgi:hypothetical protein
MITVVFESWLSLFKCIATLIVTIDGWGVSEGDSSLTWDFLNQHHQCTQAFGAIYIASFLDVLLWSMLKQFAHIRDESHKRLNLSLDKLLDGKFEIEK